MALKLNMNLINITTPLKKNKNGFSLLFIFFFFGFNQVEAQVHNIGALYVGDSGTLLIKSGTFTVASGASNKTTRTGATKGKIIFDNKNADGTLRKLLDISRINKIVFSTVNSIS